MHFTFVSLSFSDLALDNFLTASKHLVQGLSIGLLPFHLDPYDHQVNCSSLVHSTCLNSFKTFQCTRTFFSHTSSAPCFFIFHSIYPGCPAQITQILQFHKKTNLPFPPSFYTSTPYIPVGITTLSYKSLLTPKYILLTIHILLNLKFYLMREGFPVHNLEPFSWPLMIHMTFGRGMLIIKASHNWKIYHSNISENTPLIYQRLQLKLQLPISYFDEELWKVEVRPFA